MLSAQSWAISRLERPRTINATISASRRVRPASKPGRVSPVASWDTTHSLRFPAAAASMSSRNSAADAPIGIAACAPRASAAAPRSGRSDRVTATTVDAAGATSVSRSEPSASCNPITS